MQRAGNPTSRRSNVTGSGPPPASAFAVLATPSPAYSPFSSNDNSNSNVNMSTCFRSRRRVTLMALLGFAAIIALTLRSENRITKSLHVEYHFYNAFGGGGVNGNSGQLDSRLVSAPDNLRSSATSRAAGRGTDADTNAIPEHKRQRRPTKPIKEISLIGERNSGTTWMTSHLQKCFGGSGSGGNSNSSAVGEGGVVVRDYLIRYKHFFQHEGVRESNQSENTYVIAMFRNPYHWIEAMRAVPHHAPMHYKLDWKDYLETPWTMPRSPADLELLKEMEEGTDADTTKIKCQYGYTFNQINSCLRDPFKDDEDYAEYFKQYWKTLASNSGTKPQVELKLPGYSGKRPQYEMKDDGSGEPYQSILHLRADKIHNFLSIADWEWVGGFRSLRYEEMLQEGTAALIADLERLTGVKANCEPSPPQNRPQRELSPEFIEYMNEHVDWDAEGRVGYRKLSFMMD